MADLRPPAAQPTGHIRRSATLTLLAHQVCHPDPDGVDPFVRGVPPIPALIPPLLVRWVRGGPVDLNASAVLHVQVVEVPIAGSVLYPSLSAGRRQPMATFHSPHVTEFKNRQRASAGVAKSQFYLLPPADPRPRR
jgi:hypothetical protein